MHKKLFFSNIMVMSLFVFIVGGLSYGLIELIFRGFTHWTMVLTGGSVVLTLYILLPVLTEVNVVFSALIGCALITLYELVVGLIVNLWLHWDVWNYSGHKFNLLGQICPLYSFYWFLICLAFFLMIKYNISIFKS